MAFQIGVQPLSSSSRIVLHPTTAKEENQGTTRTSTALFMSSSSTPKIVLTERQMQFWEDVDSGLDDIEAYYQKQGQNIDRIRQFAQSAQGLIDPPKGYGPGHEPSEEHVEGLRANPFWDAANMSAEFPWASKLEEQSDIIVQEFQKVVKETSTSAQAGGGSNVFASDSAWQNQVMGGGWSAIRLQRLGVWNTMNCQIFPETYQLLKSLNIPLAVRGVCFARQAPGTGVQPHSDGRNFILTSHLGIQIPVPEEDDFCWIQVGNERQSWQEGKVTTLDTSFSHSTGNPTQGDRYVLIIDFWHPDLTEPERTALEFIYDLRNKFESGEVPFRKPKKSTMDDDESDGVMGWWNKLTGGDN